MEIKTFKKLKGNIYEIELDNFKKYKLYDDIILKYELLIEKKISDKKLEQIVEENNLLDAYYQSLKYINVKMRSEKEIREYLRRKSFNQTECDYAVKKLRETGYINETKYIKAYINDSLNLGLNGPKKIEDSLKNLGLEESLVQEYIDEIDNEVWIQRIEKILEKKAKTNKSSEKLFKSKITTFLLNSGYYYEDIKKCVERFKIDSTTPFLKEAEKIYNKLSSKYEGSELTLRFKRNMFSKGYESSLISDFIDKKS